MIVTTLQWETEITGCLRSAPKIINSTTFNSTALFIVYAEGQKHDKSGFGNGTYGAKGGWLPLICSVSPCQQWIFLPSGIYSLQPSINSRKNL